MMGASRLRYLGRSTDGRTNRWELSPACGCPPQALPTTMLRTGFAECRRCGARYFIDYNHQIVARVDDGTNPLTEKKS